MLRYRSRTALSCALVLGSFLPSRSLAGLMTSHSWEITGTQASEFLASGALTTCDLNHDGHRDVIVGADSFDGAAADTGKVWVYLGTATGPSTTASWTAEGDQSGDLFGFEVACADFNGDGFDDLAISANGYTANGLTAAGAVFLWYGGSSGPGNPTGLGPNGTPTNAAWATFGSKADADYGYSIADAGDVNKDGVHDLIVGAPHYNGTVLQPLEGKVYVYLGSPSGLPTTASWTAEPSQAEAVMGGRVASAGDVNGDGYADILIDSCYESPPNPNTCPGRAFLYLGSATGLGPNGTPSNADWFADGDGVGQQFGYWLGTAGDVNRDGYGDVIIGASEETVNAHTQAGRVYVWFGGPSGTGNPSGLGPNGTPANADWKAEGDQTGGRLGFFVGTAEDVNGDGYADIWSCSFDYSPGGLTQAGATWIWFGGPSGLGPTGTPSNADWVVQGDVAGESYGSQARGTGDLNGDGFGDFVVSASGATVNGNPNAGEVYIYFGTCGSTDGDGDGVAPPGAPGCKVIDLTDCNDADGTSWSTPEEVVGLLFADKTTISWTPAVAGTAEDAMRYDVLRSGQAGDFVNGTLCLATDVGPAATATDTDAPSAGSLFAYLPRARNGCPTLGSLGTNSANQPRAGRTCP